MLKIIEKENFYKISTQNNKNTPNRKERLGSFHKKRFFVFSKMLLIVVIMSYILAKDRFIILYFSLIELVF